MTKYQTVCPYCGTGCNIDLYVENGRIVEAKPTPNHPVNDGELCLKGWYGWEYVHSPKRLTKPLIRKKDGKFSKDGKLEEASWEEAYNLVASKIKESIEKYGPNSIFGFSSARCLNEDNYVFQKFFRALGTNNIDHCARL
ncbi:NADH dehydrogenase I chain G [Caminibacter mediatlanticus TB-2]|uniref:NADH dehydrogenase I chain G n=3 Tax=Caminibacter mediatlanticus TaxID=291048 RepID=A0AAI9AJ33_9BACT|nr:NADH dehydrogenase I chain G [Caminibacter mediatlanticus TB-2]